MAPDAPQKAHGIASEGFRERWDWSAPQLEGTAAAQKRAVAAVAAIAATPMKSETPFDGMKRAVAAVAAVAAAAQNIAVVGIVAQDVRAVAGAA